MISIIKSLTSGLREPEDKFSPLAKLDQMPFGVLCLNILEDPDESQNRHAELQSPVARMALSEGTTGVPCVSSLGGDEPCPPRRRELH